MKRLTKWISMLLAVMMIMNFTMFSLAEYEMDTNKSYKSQWFSTIGSSAQEMIETSELRAIVTAGLVMEWSYMTLSKDFNYAAALTVYKSFIGRNGDDIVVYLQDAEKAILFDYNVKSTYVLYQFIDKVPNYATKAIFDELCKDGSYENDMDIMVDIMIGFIK